MKIPEPEISIQSLIDAHHENIAEQPRSHMGASSLGHHCDRWLWFQFRWVVRSKFPGRILRLFRRGHNEEPTIISDLRAIGIDVRKVSAQHRVDFGSHVGGSLDAIIERGVPGAPKAKHIAEFKTHSKKSFDALVKDGVEKSKPEHFVQMQVYMMGTKIDRALYVAVCKDDDRIHTERLHYDHSVASKAIDRGKRIALSDRMPEPISSDPSWYACKWCDGHDQCFGSKTTKQVSCRTCAHSTALPDTTWHCARWDSLIEFEYQLAGCDSHVLHHDIVPWKRKDSSVEWVAAYEINGRTLNNGAPDENVYSSKELLANPDACGTGDEFIAELRSEMGGRIVA